MPDEKGIIGKTGSKFLGFEHPSANYIYCPNQFFDVCLPNCSRGGVRFVAYLLRRTLGWRDENGNPIEETFSVADQDFIEQAGISKGAIRSVSNEVVSRGFVCRTQDGKPKSKGNAGQSAEYTLRWNERGEYVTDLNAFQGFYAGGGNCSPVPNAFFDQVVPFKRLAVTKVVGTVLRQTIGFESKYGGGRRQQTSLSLSLIQRYANIKDRTTTKSAVDESRDGNFIRCIDKGSFHSSEQRSAVYAPVWLDEATNEAIGTKTLPALNRFKNPTSIGPRTRPVDQYKNPTSRNTSNKNTNKQHAAVFSESIQLLCKEGFDEHAVGDLARVAPFEEIQKQIAWIDLRKPTNRLGMLRTAIEQKWEEPAGAKESTAKQRSRSREQEQDAMQTASDAAIEDEVRKHNDRRKVLLVRWRDRSEQERKQYHNDAIAEARSTFDRTQLRGHTNLSDPPMATLEVMARALGIATVS